jgi:phosphoserine phosphatase RsbU/P
MQQLLLNLKNWGKGFVSYQEGLPWQLLVAVVTICLIPAIANLVGFNFSASPIALKTAKMEPDELNQAMLALRGVFLHVILEWTSVCLALVTGACSLLHYSLRRNLATPILGISLVVTGLIDAFHTLAAFHMISGVADSTQFIPFTYALSRICHATILGVGAAFALGGRQQLSVEPTLKNLRTLLAVGVIVGMGAYSLIYICANVPNLPQTIFPNSIVCRPWDAAALVVYMIAAGFLIPRLMAREPSLFTQGMSVSLIPLMVGEAYVAFHSREQFDNAFNIAQGLKILAYLVPLTGLLIDYTRAYQQEAELLATRATLEIARKIQQGLLPSQSPIIPHYEIFGFSTPAGAVGGDYFDYLNLKSGETGVVVADVSGHDVGASILMAQTRAYLRAEADASPEGHRLITRLNSFLSHDVNDRRFVSLFYFALNPHTHQLSYVAAGQMGYRISTHGAVHPLQITSPVLGIVDGDVPRGPTLELKPGELLLVFTDGLPETVSATSGKAFGNEGIFDIARKHLDASPNQLAQLILAAVTSFSEKPVPADDLTMIILKRLT